MKHDTLKWSLTVVALAGILLLAACGKKPVATSAPPPPPPAPAPTASLSANPSTVEKGQSTTLTWQTANATDVTINNGVGKVQSSGSQQVMPDNSTTYRLTARGAGGTQEATARVTVTQGEVTPPPVVRDLTLEEDFNRNVRDALFDYDKYDIRPDAQQALQADAAFLKRHPEVRIAIEGHCDERGSTEYNLALGDNRARAAKDALVQLGISAERMNPISFGKEKPVCNESNEGCWQRNRRAHPVMNMGR